MSDERNTPQEEDAEEVEAHSRQRRSDEPDVTEIDSDDEVEAHSRMRAPIESRMHEPTE